MCLSRMSDCEQRDRESKERIRAASPPGVEVQEEDSTDGVGVDQERSSPCHSGEIPWGLCQNQGASKSVISMW